MDTMTQRFANKLIIGLFACMFFVLLYLWAAMPVFVFILQLNIQGGILDSISQGIFIPADLLSNHWQWYEDYQSRQFFYWFGEKRIGVDFDAGASR